VVPADVMRAATPQHVRAVANGPLVSLRWSLTKRNNYPIVIQQADEIGSKAPQLLPRKTVSTTITGLDTSKGYCFLVGAMVAVGTSNGMDATIAWSKPACVRGAHVQ
jgi:hypothetical protein